MVGVVAQVYGFGGAEMGVYPVAVQSSGYTAVPGNLVPANISGGGFTVTLPEGPADGSRVAVKIIATNTTVTNVLTVATQGTDRFNESGGPASASLTLANQGQIYQYSLSAGLWYIMDDSLPLGGLKSLFRYIFPSGDSTGATDTAAINAGLASGGAVQLVQAPLSAPYYINAPITPTSQSRLWGAQWWSASDNDYYSAGVGASGGTVIVMVSGFTGAAAIDMTNTTSTQYYGVDLAGFTIEGYELSAGTIYGILIDGAWGAGFIRGVCVHRPPSDCLRFITDATSGKIPDDWQVTQCKFSASRAGNGVYLSELADSWFSDCESSENDLDGWYVNYGVNTRWTACKAENNGSNGFHLGGIGGYQVQFLTACSTHLNTGHGFLFDNSGAGGGTGGLYVLTGCVAQQDGQRSTSGGYAGFQASGCKEQVIGAGCAAQEDSTGDYPQYGASQVSSSAGMCFTGSWLKTAAGVTHDDGSNTIALVNQAVPYSGPALPEAGGTLTGALVPAVTTLTFGSSIAVNAALGNVFAVTLTASTGTLANPTNPADGQAIRVRVIQDSTGSRTLAYGTAYDFGAAGAPILSTTAAKVDILGFEYVASLSKWCYLGAVLGN
jgi:hypothetical protein